MTLLDFLEKLEELPVDFRRGDALETYYEIGEANSDSGELWAVTPRELEFIKIDFKEEFENFWTVSEPYPSEY